MTKIEWTHRSGTKGESWNPIRAKNLETGGTGHFCIKTAAGCANCYAERMQAVWFKNPVRFTSRDLDTVRLFLDTDTLARPTHWMKPRTIFVCSMTDLFGGWVHYFYQRAVLWVARECPQHTFLFLTKRPVNMAAAAARWCEEFGELPANVWLGISVCEQKDADRLIPDLLATPAALRFVSVEPMLEAVRLDGLTRYGFERAYVDNALTGFRSNGHGGSNGEALDWVICGGESGPGRRPMDLDWARALRDQCKVAGVPFFFKQVGDHSPIPPDLDIKEFPEC